MKTTIAERNASQPAAGVALRVTREMVHARTLELARLAGRNSHQIKQVDYEGAKRELTGESDFDRQQAVLDFREYY